MTCLHNEHTAALIEVAYLEDSNRYQAEISISCVDCGTAFRFPESLPIGVNLDGVTTNSSGTLLRTAVIPVNQQVSGGRDV